MLRRKMSRLSLGARMSFCVFVCWLLIVSIVQTLYKIVTEVEQVNVSSFCIELRIFATWSLL